MYIAYHSISFSLSHLKWLSNILVVVAGICKNKKGFSYYVLHLFQRKARYVDKQKNLHNKYSKVHFQYQLKNKNCVHSATKSWTI